MHLKEAAQIVLDHWLVGEQYTENASEVASDVHETGDVGNTNDIIEAFLTDLCETPPLAQSTDD